MNEKLVAQIAQEAKELADVPKIPIRHFYQGAVQRCAFCGAVVPKQTLEEWDKYRKGPKRLACEVCRGISR